MTLKREIKDAYIEGGNSIYVKTHSNAVYVNENETETLTQRLDNVKSSITEHASQLNAIAPNTTIWFLNNINEIRTRAILTAQGFYNIEEDFNCKYRVVAIDGTESWTSVSVDGNNFKLSDKLEIALDKDLTTNDKKLRPIISNENLYVDSLGAKGDGINDDTIFIQKAIDYTNSLTKKRNIKFLNKTYLTTKPLVLYDCIYLIGNCTNDEYHRYAKIINTTSDMFSDDKDLYGINFYGLEFEGSIENKTKLFQKSNTLHTCYWGKIEKCSFVGFYKLFNYHYWIGMKFFDSYINNVYTMGELMGSDNMFENLFVAVKRDNEDDRPSFVLVLHSMSLSRFRNIYFTGGETVGTGAKNILCLENDCRGNVFENNWFDYSDACGIYIWRGYVEGGTIGNDCKCNSFSHNTFRGNCRNVYDQYENAITIMGCSNNTFTENNFLLPHIGVVTGNENLFGLRKQETYTTNNIIISNNTYQVNFKINNPNGESENIYINEPILKKYPTLYGNYSNLNLDGEFAGIKFNKEGKRTGQLFYHKDLDSFVFEHDGTGGFRFRGDIIPLDTTKSIGADNNRWKDIYLLNSPNVSSKRELKENISLFDDNKAFDGIQNLNIYTYNFKEGNGENMLGSIYDELPIECINEHAEGVDLYAYTSYCISALKVAIKKIKELETKINSIQ